MGPPHDERVAVGSTATTSIGSGSATERGHRLGALGIVADIFRRSVADEPWCPVRVMLRVGRDVVVCPWGPLSDYSNSASRPSRSPSTRPGGALLVQVLV